MRVRIRCDFSRVQALACAAILGAGCAPGSEERTPAPPKQAAGAAQSRTCLDSVETRALACSNGAARRVGDSLFLKLDTVERRMLNYSHGEMEQTFRYVGRIG